MLSVCVEYNLRDKTIRWYPNAPDLTRRGNIEERDFSNAQEKSCAPNSQERQANGGDGVHERSVRVNVIQKRACIYMLQAKRRTWEEGYGEIGTLAALHYTHALC
jgi:hypothetical protein